MKQTVHDWSTGVLVETEIDAEMPEPTTPPPTEPSDALPTADTAGD